MSITSAPATSPYLSAITDGKATADTLHLTILDAINRGLKNNLGLFLSGTEADAARAERLRRLSDLLPNVQAHSNITRQKLNLAVFGIPLGPGVPTVVGPFDVLDSRATVTQSILDLHALNNSRASVQDARAAALSRLQARELVVLVVGNAYLLANADAARVETANAQYNTAKTIYDRAVDLKKAGVVAGIDVLRAQVQMQSQQQRLLAARNDFQKQKLALARAIGLPPAQEFDLADKVPYAPDRPMDFATVLDRAYRSRPDYLAAQSRLRAAELSKRAAEAEYLPSIAASGDYGAIGRTFGDSRATYSASLGVKVPVFTGGKNRADVLDAEVTRRQREAELGDLRSGIEFEIRDAMLDVASSAERVQVAQQSVELAGQQLAQAQDRFTAGVSGNLELVQSQEAVASANEDLISSLYAHNVAKLMLARAAGVAEAETKNFLENK